MEFTEKQYKAVIKKLMKENKELTESLSRVLKFQVGQKYNTHFGHGVFAHVHILSRKDKTVTFRVGGNRQSETAEVVEVDGSEEFYPHGKYWLCPTCKASNIVIN